MVFDPGSSQRNANINPSYTSYINPVIKNTDYDENNPYGIDLETERVIDTPQGKVVIGKNAPRGFGSFSNLKRLIDAVSGNRWDLDMRGPGANAWGDLPESGYGRAAKEVPTHVENPRYPGDASDPNAGPVPEIDQFGNVVNRVGQDIYTDIRDTRTLNQRLAMSEDFLKEANYYRMMLDQAERDAYLATSRGMAETNLVGQQAQYLSEAGKAEKIKAIAERQKAANEFGTLALAERAAALQAIA